MDKTQKLVLAIICLLILLSSFLFFKGSQYVEEKLPEVKEILTSSPSPVVSEIIPEEVLEEGTSSAQEANSNLTKVLKVVDGDTIEAEISGQRERIRFIGIDTPETVDPRRPVQCFGVEASNENKKLLEGKSVLLEKDISETDKYNRLLRYIFLPEPDGSRLFINDYLVRQGFAKVSTYPPDVKYDQQFKEAQEEARINKRGLWSRC
jgi:endonuclease YncB( thermonuclease family)